MIAFRCMTDRTFAILSKKIGNKELTEKAYRWFDSLDISVRREVKMVVTFIMENRSQWDK